MICSTLSAEYNTGKLALLSYIPTKVHELVVDDTVNIIAMLQQQLTYTVLKACLTRFVEHHHKLNLS